MLPMSMTDFFAQAAEAGVDLNAVLAGNSTTLRDRDEQMWDRKLQMIARQRLNGIADLKAKGLTVGVGGLGTMLSVYERAGDMTKATVNMEGAVESNNDRLTFDNITVPIPIFQKDFSLNKRQLMASAKREPLSTTQLAIATRLVADELETTLFNGLPNFEVDGKRIYGYTNYPQRNTVSLSYDWEHATGTQILNDVKNMLQAAYDDNRFGPFCIYVPKEAWANIQGDYSTEKGDRTIKERIEAYIDIDSVKAGDYMSNGNVVMVQMTEDVIDLAVGQDLVYAEWQNMPMVSTFKVYTAMAPRLKSDRNGSCGIVHGSYTIQT